MPQTRRGLNLVLLASAVSRGLGLAQSVLLGSLLTREDFGVYATAVGVQMFTGALRGGGAWMVLGSIRSEDFGTQGRSVFTVGLSIGLFGALLTLAAALPVSGAYQLEGLSLVLAVLGIQLAAAPFQQFAQMRISADLGFSRLSMVLLASSVLRFSTALWTAWRGHGAIALVLPQLAATVLEAVLCAIVGRMKFQYFRPDFRSWFPTVRRMGPVIAIAVLNSVNLQADYFIGSIFLGTGALGLYSFAYSIASQPYLLLTVALQRVLVPASARVLAQPAAREDYLSGMATTVIFVVPAVCIALAIAFPLADRVVWGGKWAEASGLVAILCIGLSGPVAVGILVTPLLAERKFRAVLMAELVRAISVIGGALLGVSMLSGLTSLATEPSAAALGLALGVSTVTTVSSVFTAVWLLHAAGLRTRPLVEALTIGPATCLLAGYGAWSVSQSLGRSFDVLDTRPGAVIIAVVTIVLYALMLLCALQLVPSLRAAYVNVAEPGLDGLKRFAQRLHLPVGD
ncbi:MAG: oligosaccharide flippase family protein [Bacteroidia bacterium]|nr:oligosaccharide flippase family protein [Bacteroidia bacterium]